MNHIEHIIEPRKLLLSWQGSDRTRYIVAELSRQGDDADLTYLRNSPDYLAAKEKGFAGEYPGFPADSDHQAVLAAFMTRLPPRYRTDYDAFLKAIRIHAGAQITDFALLGYAGGRLPSDDFCIIHPFDQAEPPFEFLLPLAGYRYYQQEVPYDAVKIGMPVRFELEPSNPHDPEAVRAVVSDVSENTAGYVCRGLLPQFRRWLGTGLGVLGTVERKNGVDDRPLIYVYVSVLAPGADSCAAGRLAGSSLPT